MEIRFNACLAIVKVFPVEKLADTNWQQQNPKPRRALWGLVSQRPCWVPTWRGWALLATLAVALVCAAGLGLHPFLAPYEPMGGEVLVVEGWTPDYGLEESIRLFQARGYRRLLVTGGPLEVGSPLSEYKTYAERSVAILHRLGMPLEQVQAVPAPDVQRDRTYNAAVALRQYFAQQGAIPSRIDIISMGPHARRTRLLYEIALGESASIGIMALPVRDYDPQRWWQSSGGVRGVIDETIAYLYARLLFRP